MTDLKRTPLYAFHTAHGARMVPFAGWEMPVQYTGILEEHRTVREAAGLFDVSHMGEARVTGPQAVDFLNHLVTNEVSTLPVGRALYTVMCYPSGGVVDDLIIYRTGPSDFFLCINAGNTAKDLTWMNEQVAHFACCVSDESALWGQLAIQGPKSLDILQALTQVRLDLIPKMGFEIGGVAQIPGVIIARTGYTGEDGFELYVPVHETEHLANVLVAAGLPKGLKLTGLGARDSLRLEAGFPLYGHELSDSITPLQAGLSWVVKLAKTGDFVGKAALAAEKAAGVARRVVFYRINDRRIARQGTPVIAQGKAVGEVLSGSLSPFLNCAIGSALVDARADTKALSVELRGTVLPLEVAKPPLHKK
ncbi:MAG: glycine cleavage system aminomethyltransferase GcvT [Verrucomicrobiota bacterium]|nr:glycine cleavage system aminomethyltransferase GcvT [Verrucomicrobiota bacterium]